MLPAAQLTPNAGSYPTHRAAGCAVRLPLHQAATLTPRLHGALTAPVLAEASETRVAILSWACSSHPPEVLPPSERNPAGEAPAEAWGNPV